MKKQLEFNLKQKLIASFTVVLCIQIIIGLSFMSKMKLMDREITQIVDHAEPALTDAKDIQANIGQLNMHLALYLLEREDYHLDNFTSNMLNLHEEINRLEKSTVISSDESVKSHLRAIKDKIDVFNSYRDTAIELVKDNGKNIPATQYASDHVNPLSMQISQMLSGMIQSEETEDATETRKQILFDLNNLRYDWSNMVNEMRLYLAFRNDNAKQNMTLYKESVQNKIQTVKSWGDELNFEQADAIEQVESLANNYISHLGELIKIHESDKWRMDAWIFKNQIEPDVDAINTHIEAVLAATEAISHKANETVNEVSSAGKTATLWSMVGALLLLATLAWLLIRNIQNMLGADPKKLQMITEAIARGDFKCKLNIKHPKGVYRSVIAMQKHLRESIEKELRAAKINGRVKQALDNVTTNVMIADENLEIIYLNDVAQNLMHELEPQLRANIASFDANKIVGSKIDIFHKDPAHQQQLLAKLDGTHRACFPIGDRTVNSVITPVRDEQGKRIGTVIEMTDRTAEQAIENELQEIINFARDGDLGHRVDMQNKHGFFARMAEGINEMVDVCDRVINDTLRVIGAMAQGDLTHEIKSDYSGSFGQLKSDVNATIHKLTEVMAEIRNNADMVMTGTEEISQGNNNLSQRTEQQASNLEETASSMEEMTSTVRQNADNARQANQLAAGARSQAEQGGVVVGNAITAMNEITQSSNRIAAIISVIDEIAFQTNLLALNAAVEAARAGEQGRGFAVVASEVRNLAGRSATAAKEIKDLIEDTVSKIEEGSKLVDDSGNTLEDIVLSVQKVNDIIAEIASASLEQSEGIEQVNKAIAQMDEMTQQNAALVEEAASASESMSEQAASLNQLVSFFKTGTDSSYQGTERRQANRPWSDKPGLNKPSTTAASTDQQHPAKTSAGGEDWEEF